MINSAKPSIAKQNQIKCIHAHSIVLGITPKSLSKTPVVPKDAKWVFKQYDLPAPAWLRAGFVLKRSRVALLNKTLYEAGLDEFWCPYVKADKSWATGLHCFWHQINRM